MAPTSNEPKFWRKPSLLEGGIIARVLEQPDGKLSSEVWRPDSGWVPTPLRVSEFFIAAELSPEELARRGVTG